MTLDISDKIVNEVFSASHNGERYLYGKGKLTKKEFWKRARKKLNIDKKTSDLFRKIWHEEYKPIRGTWKISKRLRKKYKVVVFSGTIRERIRYFYKKFKLRKEFREFYYSYSLGYNKADLKFYKILLKRLKEDPKECLLIDDASRNIRFFKSLGGKGIVFKNPKQLERDLKRMEVL